MAREPAPRVCKSFGYEKISYLFGEARTYSFCSMPSEAFH
jgi:hypothetical protein